MRLLLILFLTACSQAPTKPKQLDPVVVKPTETRSIFVASSTLNWTHEVARVANCVVQSGAFLADLAAFPKYTYTDKTPAQVAEAYRVISPITIKTYRTKNPFSAAIATTFKGEPGVVYFNTRKNPRPMTAMVNTAIHEGGHAIGFGHGDNSPGGKEDSVNYRAGTIAERHVEGCL